MQNITCKENMTINCTVQFNQPICKADFCLSLVSRFPTAHVIITLHRQATESWLNYIAFGYHI